MSEDFAPGVSRTLDALARQFTMVVWQAGKPPLDAELNLSQQVAWENLAQVVRDQAHSGFFIDPSRTMDDFSFDPRATNLFYFGRKVTDELSQVLFANVNGWVLPVAGTGMVDGILNAIRLYPPPDTDYRVDLVFLEVWKAKVAPIPSTVNKPTSSTLWKYGNVEFGGTNLTDDIEDPAIGFETTERVQLQYRIRVVGSGSGLGASISLETYPDGVDDPSVFAQGAAPSPTAFHYANMRTELGDPSLWRAGDGNYLNTLGTTDGYAYAIPICAVFRRNNTPFVAVTNTGSPNQNGDTNRTPSSYLLPDPRSGARVLTLGTLTGALGPATLGNVAITSLSGSALGDPALFTSSPKRFLVLGTGVSQEIIAFTSANVPGGTIAISERGRAGTLARRHPAGTPVVLYSTRESLYSDETIQTDILDLRRAITFGDWDHQEILQAAVAALIKGDLRSTPKKSGTGGNTFGVVTTEASYFHNFTSSALPNWVGQVDGPDGIRTIWSDSAAPQGDISLLLDPSSPLTPNGYTATTFDANVALQWTVGADFQPSGFLPTGISSTSWKNCAVINLYLGGNGTSGQDGALSGFCQSPNPKAVRFLTPREMWKTVYSTDTTGQQHPWRVRFVGGSGNSSSAPGPLLDGWMGGRFTTPAGYEESVTEHPGPMYPRVESNFEKPFIVLGTLLNPNLSISLSMAVGTLFAPTTDPTIWDVEVGLNFDLDGNFYHKNGNVFSNDPSDGITNPLLEGTRTLWGMLTDNGRDNTGNSSEVYMVLTGDITNQYNNGVFKVVGAGKIAEYTVQSSIGPTLIRVKAMGEGFVTLTDNPTVTMKLQLRSQYMAQGVATSYIGGMPDAMVVFTDLQNNDGTFSNPWNGANLGTLAPSSDTFMSKIVLDTTVLWGPARGASLRIPESILRFSLMGGDPSHVRNQMSDVDPAFCTEAGFPSLERLYDPAHVQLWNRLPSLGLDAPDAPNYGGAVVGLSEIDREHELFIDKGSKTVIFRPMKFHRMTLKGQTVGIADSLMGASVYLNGNVKDGAHLFTGASVPRLGYAVPPEYMPRFGRQDIPYHTMVSSTDPILPGINHLFSDNIDPTKQTFYIMGGEDNTAPASNAVYPMLYDSASSPMLPYGVRSTITGPPEACYMARKIHDPTVVSSDLGYGMWGVELPPFQGIARLYGVYERRDYVNNVAAGHSGAYASDRITPLVPGPVNLLKKNATQQTLYIRRGGGADACILGEEDAHTYVVPESAIDITISPYYTGTSGGQYFNDFDYVIECEIFGFGLGFINRNNFVLARQHTGAGVTVVEGTDPELTQVEMILSAPATRGDAMYEAYSRTVYQGDPYMTRDGSSPLVSDVTSRYGQILSAESYYLGTSIQQFDPTTGAMIVERPNARGLQVLASMDFFTTLGTGKIGGQTWAGTPLDAGFIDPIAAGGDGRIAKSLTQTPWMVLPRAFSEGQKNNVSRASLSIQFLDNTYLDESITYLVLVFTHLDGTTTYLYSGPTHDFIGADTEGTAQALATLINTDNRFTNTCRAFSIRNRVIFQSVQTGTQGNQIRVEMFTYDRLPASMALAAQFQSGSFLGGYHISNAHPNIQNIYGANFEGGMDIPVNAGLGGSEIGLTGFTERLPLGILMSDSDFLGENVAGDNASSLVSFPGGIRSVYTGIPLTSRGEDYTRFLGTPGEMLSMSDGSILTYIPYNHGVTPPLSGTRSFRIYRGGGAGFMMSGNNPGGPLNWVSESFPASSRPILKGAALACKALLVRNFHEEAFAMGYSGRVRTEGDELQMVILTYGIFGDGHSVEEGVTLHGMVSPTGYGEGYAAMDRYRLNGRPMDRGRVRTTPDPTQPPAPYPGNLTP